MLPTDCEQLDDYLAGDLDDATSRGFAVHLHDCDACRQAVALNRRLGQLLADARPKAPAGLVARIDRRLRREQFTRTAQRSGLLAAAVILVALGIWATRTPNHGDAPASPQIAVAPLPEVRIRFPDEKSVIAVPLKSKNPRVSIVWVYPTVQQTGPDANTATESQPN